MVQVVYNWLLPDNELVDWYMAFLIPDSELFWAWLDYLHSPLGKNYKLPNGMYHLG